MRKLIVSINVTLDGFMADPDCGLGWHFKYWNEEIGDALAAEMYKADCLLLGRITYCGMMHHWQDMTKQPTLPRSDMGFFTQIADCKKIVCSNTLTKASWNNSTILKGEINDKLAKLKNSKGKNIIVYGSGQLVSALMKQQLVDELQLWIHPVLLGKGKALFKEIGHQQYLSLESTKHFSSGVVMLKYECEKI